MAVITRGQSRNKTSSCRVNVKLGKFISRIVVFLDVSTWRRLRNILVSSSVDTLVLL